MNVCCFKINVLAVFYSFLLLISNSSLLYVVNSMFVTFIESWIYCALMILRFVPFFQGTALA